MGLFDKRRPARPADQFERREQNGMIPRWSRPPERNTSDWLKSFSTSPRLAVVERIASDLSFAPGKLYQYDSQGNEREIMNHPFIDFWENPNPLYEFSNAALWRLQEIYLLLKGEGYFIIERDSMGRPAELWPVPVQWVMMTPYLNHPYYTIRTTSGVMMDVSVDDMFIMKDINPIDPFMRGLGQSEAVADEVEIDEYAAKFQKRFFYNDATPNLIAAMPGSTDEQRKRFRMEWLEKFKGVFKSHGLATTGGDISIHKLSDNMKDMDMIQGRTFTRNAVLEHFGVPREIMGITESSNRATSEAAQFIYAQNVLMPKLRRREEAINQQLIPMFGDNIFWRFDDIVPRNQEFDKVKAIEGWNAGLLTKDEARELLDMPSADHGGDVYKTTFSDVFISADENPADLSLAMANLQYADESIPTDGDTVEVTDVGEDEERTDEDIELSDVKALRLYNQLKDASYRSMEMAQREQSAKFEIATVKFFREQNKRLLASLTGAEKAAATPWDILNQYISSKGEDMVDIEAWAKLTDDERKRLVDGFVNGLVDWPGEEKTLTNIFTPLWKETYDKGATAAQKVYGLTGRVDRPELVSTAKLLGGQRIRHIEDTTKHEIRKIITTGIDNGDSRKTLTDAIMQEMGTSTARARLIADQETTTSLQSGQYDMMRKAGAQTKTWHHRHQKDPRDGTPPGTPNHVAMDGETVPVDAKFSNGLRFPKDPECGDAAEVINCRCFITYSGF